MKKLRKMKLKEHSVLSKKEMKNVTGGQTYGSSRAITTSSCTSTMGSECILSNGSFGKCAGVGYGTEIEIIDGVRVPVTDYTKLICDCVYSPN